MIDVFFCPTCNCPLQHLPSDPVMAHAVLAHYDTCHPKDEK